MSEGVYTITVALPRISRTKAVAALSAVLGALAATLVLTLAGTSSAPAPAPAAAAAFHVALPSGWRAASQAELAHTPSAPSALLRSGTRDAVVVIHESAPVATTAAALTRSLGSELQRRYRGVHPVGARIVAIRAGNAYVYTFVRGSRVQSIAVASVGARTYTLDSDSPGTSPQLARQVAAIIGSFGS